MEKRRCSLIICSTLDDAPASLARRGWYAEPGAGSTSPGSSLRSSVDGLEGFSSVGVSTGTAVSASLLSTSEGLGDGGLMVILGRMMSGLGGRGSSSRSIVGGFNDDVLSW